jgi:desulfoferrodoxin (superoxide reductase-like protein)
MQIAGSKDGGSVYTESDREVQKGKFRIDEDRKGGVTVTSTCNLHDMWIKTVKI